MCNCMPILIVDDNPFNLKVLEGMLKLLGTTAIKAFNGREACNIVK